jgi:lysozyme family protein
MQANYKSCIDRIINKYEGGYGWSKSDPGGPTRYGITCYDLAEHRGQKMTSMAAWAPLVQAMPLAEAEAIYSTKYATGVQFNALPSGVDMAMLDYGINSGISRPILVAAELLKLPNHTRMDPTLLAAIQKADPKWLIDAMCKERLAFMHGIRGGSMWAEFGHGWQTRVDDVDSYSDALASPQKPIPAAPDLSKTVTPKASHVDPKTDTKATIPTVVVAGGAAAAAGAAGAPAWVVGAVVLGALVLGLAFYLWQQHKAAAANATVVIPPNVTPQPVSA